MTDEEKKIEATAFQWVKKNKQFIYAKFAELSSYQSDSFPTTIFMAGSPGAGKTEVSRRLAEIFEQQPVIIDADEIRKLIDGYTGKNAYLFQKAANKGVNMLYDYVCKKGLNAIMDGTFAYADPIGNIEHSLKYNRNVEIYFLYQDPLLSWEFTKKREEKEFRNVPKSVFITSYLKSLENVKFVKQEFKGKIKLNLVIKDFVKGIHALELNESNIESFLPKVYTSDELEKFLE